jgi:prepilin-type N-terminal cleavage/methylation domain-containing protein
MNKRLAIRRRWIRRPATAPGFTMLELLVALAILVTAMAIIYSTFSAALSGWTKGNKLLDELHHGDFVIEQLVLSLRSTAYFKTSPGTYGFRLNSRGGAYPRDEMSWVTSGTSFIPPDSPLLNGLYRISVTIEENKDGDPAVTVRAFPHLSELEARDIDPWHISTRVKGLNCRTYNLEKEAWEETWEDTNTVPSLVEITLYMDPLEKYDPPLTIKRLVEIPIAPAVTGAVNYTESSGDGDGGAAGRSPSERTR